MASDRGAPRSRLGNDRLNGAPHGPADPAAVGLGSNRLAREPVRASSGDRAGCGRRAARIIVERRRPMQGQPVNSGAGASGAVTGGAADTWVTAYV